MANKKNEIPFGPKQLPWDAQLPQWALGSVTGPDQDPIKTYDAVPPKDLQEEFPAIDYKKFEIPPEGLTEEEYNAAMLEFKGFVESKHKKFTGYQTNEFLEGNQELSWMLDIHTNNVGDPFTTGIFSLNTKFAERAVLDYFAALWRAEWPFHKKKEAKNSYWGYVMSMGSTEGNIYALYNGREYLHGGKMITDPNHKEKGRKRLRQGKFILYDSPLKVYPKDYYTNPNRYKPIAFYSEDTHYSVVKGVSICSVTTFAEEGRRKYPGDCPLPGYEGIWPDEVPSHNMNHDDPLSGSIKVPELKMLVEFFLEKGHPILIVLNQGSTWKGAYDNVPAVHKMLKDLGKKYTWLWNRTVDYVVRIKKKDGREEVLKLQDQRRGFWLHVDGALGAAYLPYLRMAKEKAKLEKKKIPALDNKDIPEFDFSIDAVMSIVTSMHKWIGAPWPGGIYMTRKKFQLSPPDTAGYIGSPDTTLGGSRNGFSAMLFWKYFARNGYTANINRAVETEIVAAQFESELRKLEGDLQKRFPDDDVDLWIHRSQLSLAVMFRKVNATITYKYTVDSERIEVPIKGEDGKLYSEERTYSHIYSMPSLGKYGLVEKLISEIKEACADNWKHAFPHEWLDEDKKTVLNPGPRLPVTHE